MLFAQHQYVTSCDLLMQCWDFPFAVFHVDSAAGELGIILLSSSLTTAMVETNTLLKNIKGTYGRNGIASQPNILQFLHFVCMVGDCLRYIKSHGRMIYKVKKMLLGVDAHPYLYIRIGWWYH